MSEEKCPNCNGNGKTEVRYFGGIGIFITHHSNFLICERCRGTGKINR